MLLEFEPEIIFISSGVDCMEGDPVGGLNVTSFSLQIILKRLMLFVQRKIVLVMEGGYSVSNVIDSSESFVHMLTEHIEHIYKTPLEVDD